MPIIKLESSDYVIFDTEYDIMKCSKTIKNIMSLCQMEENEAILIPLQNVHSLILGKILTWAEYHKDDNDHKRDVENSNVKNVESFPSNNNWDSEFLQIDQRTLFDLIMAANYLEINSLINLTCKNVADMIRGKSTEQIRQIFHIKNDFSEYELMEIREENQWMEE